MAEPKTKPTTASVDAFVDSLDKETQRDDCRVIIAMMKSISGKPAVMWGTAIIGFGQYRITYANGSEANWPLLAFSPRKQGTVVYIMGGFKDFEAQLKKLGKHKVSGVCLHLKSLEDNHLPSLKAILETSYKKAVKKYGK